MSDFERYGDYNEIDESPKKSKVLLAIKIVALALCFAVVALLAFRMFTFKYYPKSMKNIYFTPALTELYNEQGDDFKAETQTMNAPYDDEDQGNFMCDNLIIVRDGGNLQVSMRYNTSVADTLAAEYNLSEFDPDNEEQFSFSLVATYGPGDVRETSAELVALETESFMMYRYYKLVFEGVDFSDEVRWISLKINVDGAMVKNDDGELVPHDFLVLVYENTESANKFTEYEISKKELPDDQ